MRRADAHGGLSRPLTGVAAIACAILFATPSIFALLTVTVPYRATAMRNFALPVVAAELMLIACALVSRSPNWKSGAGIAPLTWIGCLVLFAGATLTALGTGIPDPAEARSRLTITAVHALLAFSLWSALGGGLRGQSRALVISLGLGAMLYCCLLWLFLFALRADPQVNWVRVGPAVSHVRQIGFYAVITAGIGAGVLVAARARREIALGWIMLTLGTAFAVWSGGRAAVGAILVALMVVVPFAEARIRIVAGAVLAFGVGAVLSVVWVPPHPIWGLPRILGKVSEGLASGTAEFSSNRVEMWKDAWRIFLSRPTFGWGEGQFRNLAPNAFGQFNHPHNFVLQFLVQWGALGTAAISAVILPGVVRALRLVRANPSALLPSIAALVASAAMALLEGNLFHVWPVGMIVVLLVCTVRAAEEVDRPFRTPVRS